MPHRSVKLNAEIASEAAKAAPPAMITTIAAVGGLSLNNVIGIATLVYIVLQAGYLVWKWRRDWKRDRADRMGAAE